MKRVVPLLAASLLALAACGGGVQGDPNDALADAFAALGEKEGLAFTFTLVSDVDSLTASEKGDLTEEQAQQILDSSVALNARNATDLDEIQQEITINVAGNEDAVQIRSVGTTLYARAEVTELVETFGGNPAELQAFEQQAQQAGLDFVGPALNGEWVAITELDQLVQQITGQPAEESPTPTERIYRDFANELRRKAEVEEGDEDGPGTHLRVTLTAREAIKSLLKVARRYVTSIPAQALPPENEVPNEPFVVDVWVDDGFVRQIEFDFVENEELSEEGLPEGVEELALRVAIDEFTGTVEAPADAVEIDPQQIFNLLLGAQGETGSGGEAPPGDDFCDRLKGAPPDVVAQFKKECPQLQK